MTPISPEYLLDLMQSQGGGLYGGEAVTQLEHALQCAALAQAEGALPSLVAAALLHDLGHLIPNADDRRVPHEVVAAELLEPLFGYSVSEPVRFHVKAKRYLCAENPLYWSELSEASRHSLVWQGGPYSPEQAAEFSARPFAREAVRLRKWDDTAKVVGLVVPRLNAYADMLKNLAREHAAGTI